MGKRCKRDRLIRKFGLGADKAASKNKAAEILGPPKNPHTTGKHKQIPVINPKAFHLMKRTGCTLDEANKIIADKRIQKRVEKQKRKGKLITA